MQFTRVALLFLLSAVVAEAGVTRSARQAPPQGAAHFLSTKGDAGAKAKADGPVEKAKIDEGAYSEDWGNEHKVGEYPKESVGKQHHPEYSSANAGWGPSTRGGPVKGQYKGEFNPSSASAHSLAVGSFALAVAAHLFL